MQLLRFLMLFIVMAGQLAGGSTFVLCREADGRKAVEWRAENCCQESLSPVISPDEHLSAASPAHCGNCTDSPLLAVGLRRDDAEGPPVFLPLSPAALIESLQQFPTVRRAPAPLFFPPDPAPLLHHTIILMV